VGQAIVERDQFDSGRATPVQLRLGPHEREPVRSRSDRGATKGLQPGLQLVEVRNPGETAAGTVPGARVIPLAVLVDSLPDLDADAPVVVNCAGGYRSLVAASVLRWAGFADVSDLLGGYGGWANAGLPVSGGQTADPVPAAEVGPQVADALIRDGAVLLDVREPDEWDAGRAPTAVFIPMSQVEGRLAELELTAKTVVVCRSGGRSAAITQVLTWRGFDAVNLAGGMRAWVEAGLPVVVGADEPGRII
jgi:rhodanese-related sulfurtransferase